MVRSGDYFLFESDSQEDEDDQKEDEKEEREGPDKSAFQVARLLMLYFISIHPHFILLLHVPTRSELGRYCVSSFSFSSALSSVLLSAEFGSLGNAGASPSLPHV